MGFASLNPSYMPDPRVTPKRSIGLLHANVPIWLP
jgi:hypothetical protein